MNKNPKTFNKKIKIYQMTNKEYISLLATGMFKELYPEATGNYESDIKLSHKGKFKIEKGEAYE